MKILSIHLALYLSLTFSPLVSLFLSFNIYLYLYLFISIQYYVHLCEFIYTPISIVLSFSDTHTQTDKQVHKNAQSLEYIHYE